MFQVVSLCDTAILGGPPLSCWRLWDADHVKPGDDLHLVCFLQHALATAGLYHLSLFSSLHPFFS